MRTWGRKLSPLGAVAAALAIAVVLAAPASADRIDDFQGSWADRALDLQYELSHDVPLRNAPWLGTHNSFNSTAEMGPTLSAQDSNQAIDLVSQLRIDIRSLELDLHRFPSASGPGFEPVVCHALSGGGGCTVEKTLGPVMAEIEGWLRAPGNEREVLFLYLEDDLQDEATHDKAAAVLEETIGDLIWRPPAGGCAEVPWDLTREQMLAAGKRVVIVSGCGVGEAWTAVAHSWDGHLETRPFGYEGYPGCGPDFTRTDYDGALIRYYEDSTQLTATAGNPDDGIDRRTARQMARCGVDLIGFDQLEPFDGRLRGSVWSWARRQPNRGRCALIRVGKKRPFGRWISRRCGAIRRPAACLDGERWVVPNGRNVDGRAAKRRCRSRGFERAVPRTGFENQQLREAMEKRGAKTAWLGYRKRGGSWTALDSR